VVESVSCAAGARYLAASGTDLLGTMPAISLHTELELLDRLGLTPREAIAAATANFAELLGWWDARLVEPERYADILALAGYPLDDLQNLKRIEILLKGEEIVDRNSLIDVPTVPSRAEGSSTPIEHPPQT
jgi:imidazolonepropionase-like amidohydrolase